MYQLIIKNGKVIGTYRDDLDIASKHPDCECVAWPEDIGPTMVDGVPVQPNDPRTQEQKDDYYQDVRRVTYPKIQDQLDMLYHDMIDGTHTWVDTITDIKETYPKPSEEIK